MNLIYIIGVGSLIKMIIQTQNLITHSDDIRIICDSFFDRFDIKQFNYIKIYNDGGVIYLCRNKSWLNRYLTKQYNLLGAFEQNKDLAGLRTVLWSGLSANDLIMKEGRERYGFHHGITLVERSDEATEFFNFGSSSKDPSILNELINNISYFENFITFFRDKTIPIMQVAVKQKLYFPNINSAHLPDKKQLYSDKRQFNLGPKYQFSYLTPREIECLKWFIMGKTAIEISLILNCNNRTVETHLENIKRKLNCTKQVSLGYLTAKLGIDQMWELY